MKFKHRHSFYLSFEITSLDGNFLFFLFLEEAGVSFLPFLIKLFFKTLFSVVVPSINSSAFSPLPLSFIIEPCSTVSVGSEVSGAGFELLIFFSCNFFFGKKGIRMRNQNYAR